MYLPRVVILAGLLAGCGRIGFSADGSSGGDGGVDAPLGDVIMQPRSITTAPHFGQLVFWPGSGP